MKTYTHAQPCTAKSLKQRFSGEKLFYVVNFHEVSRATESIFLEIERIFYS